MSDLPTAAEVTIDLDGHEVVAGTMRVYERHGHSTTFEYSEDYLRDPRAYDLDPALPKGSGVFRPPGGRTLFNVFSDSTPDRWGQALLRRQERDRARAVGVSPEHLGQAHFLLRVRDALRQGAIRFRRIDGGSHLAEESDGVPQMVSLPRLLAASDRFLSGDIGSDLGDLIEAGGSLGGARPKAAVRIENGGLAIAKFPRKGEDEWDVPGWERVAADLASRAGIDVATSRLIKVAGRHVFVVDRFDRAGERRIGFASGLTLLEASDMEPHSYLELADVIELYSDRPARDLEQLFRRVIFSVLVSNTDDHLRNHAFLRVGRSWVLSPAFDLNPRPDSPGRLTLAIDLVDPTASIDLALSVCPSYRLQLDRAKTIIDEVERATASWREAAARCQIPAVEMAQMEVAFETPERITARSLAGRG